MADRIEVMGFEPVCELVSTIGDLDGRDRADILLKLMEFLYPKRKAVEHSTPVSGGLNLSITDSEAKALAIRLVTNEKSKSEAEISREPPSLNKVG